MVANRARIADSAIGVGLNGALGAVDLLCSLVDRSMWATVGAGV